MVNFKVGDKVKIVAFPYTGINGKTGMIIEDVGATPYAMFKIKFDDTEMNSLYVYEREIKKINKKGKELIL